MIIRAAIKLRYPAGGSQRRTDLTAADRIGDNPSAAIAILVAFFFETVDVDGGPAAVEDAIMGVAEADQVAPDLMKKRKTVELVRAFYAIEDATQRAATLAMLKALAKSAK